MPPDSQELREDDIHLTCITSSQSKETDELSCRSKYFAFYDLPSTSTMNSALWEPEDTANR